MARKPGLVGIGKTAAHKGAASADRLPAAAPRGKRPRRQMPLGSAADRRPVGGRQAPSARANHPFSALYHLCEAAGFLPPHLL